MKDKKTGNLDKWTSAFRSVAPTMKKLGSITLKGTIPGIYDTTTSTAEILRDSRYFITESKSQIKQQAKSLGHTLVGKEVADTISSAFDDIKSGNFSLDKLTNQSYDTSDDFSDMVDDYDVDYNDPDSVALGESKKNTAMLGKAISEGNAATIVGMQNMTQTISNTQLKAASATSKQLTSVALIGINQTNAQLAGINNRLDAINSNIVSLIDFQNENVSIVNQQASEFYRTSSEMLNAMGETISGIKDFMEGYKKIEKEEEPEWDEFDFSGGFNLYSYKEMLKKNVKSSMVWSMLEMGKTMLGMSSAIGGETPLEMALGGILPKLIPKNLRNSLGRSDKMFTQTMNNLVYRLGDMSESDDLFKSMIGSIFGKKRKKAVTKLELGEFKKDAMSWNGIAQQTLVEVIPNYLAKIESALTKNEARYYDMNTGRFNTESQLKDAYKEEYTTTLEYGMNSFATDMQKALSKIDIDDETLDNVKKSINERVVNQLTGKSKDTRQDFLKGVFDTLYDAKLGGNDLRDVVMSLTSSYDETMSSMNKAAQTLSSASRNLFNQKLGKYETDVEKVIDEETLRKINIFTDVGFTSTGKRLDQLTEEERAEAEKEKNKKGIIDKIKDRLKNSGKSKNGGKTGLFANFSDSLDRLANILYDRGNGFYRSSDEEFWNEVNSVISDMSGGSTPPPATSQAIINTGNTSAEKNINKEVSKANKETLKDTLKMDRSKIESNANRTERVMKNLENNKSAKINGTEEDKNSIKAMVLSLHHNFLSPMVSGIFGKDGIVRSFFKDVLNNERVKKIREKLFDEETGVFGGVTVWMKDQMNYIKYVFTGKGYTDSNGNTYNEKEDSVFDKIANGYDRIYKNAMKYWFGDDYEENDTYNKYFKWFDFKAKRDKKRQDRLNNATEEVEANNTDSAIIKEANENKKEETNEANIKLQERYKDAWEKMNPMQQGQLYGDDIENFIKEEEEKAKKKKEKELRDKYKKSWDKMDPMQQGQLYGGDFETFIKEEEDKIRESSSKISSQLTNIANELADSTGDIVDRIVGSEEDIQKQQERSNKSIQEKFKEFLPTGLTGATIGAAVGTSVMFSGSGILGAALLPGGPISGAIAGIGLSMLSRSKKFNEFVFGKEDEDGNKTGGLISQKTQKFFKDNAPMIAGGAVLGAAKGMLGIGQGSFLLNTLLPGGPIGGALLGIGFSLLKSNDKFQEILFGEKDENGKRAGGLFSKENGKFAKFMEKSGHFVKGGLKGLGVGAVAGATLSHLGFLGSAVSLGGPVGMGLAGLGIGIASQTEAFKKLLFGDEEVDEHGNVIGRKNNGLLTKMKNMMVLNVFEPVKNKLQGHTEDFALWLKKKLTTPFKEVAGVIADNIHGIKKDVSDTIHDVFEKVGISVTKIFQNTIGKAFSPLTSALKFVGKRAVRLPFDAMKLSLFPVTAGLNLARLGTAKMRHKALKKEKRAVASRPFELIRGAIDNVKAQSAAYDQNEFNGFFGGINRGLTMVKDFKGSLRNSYNAELQKYEDGLSEEGKNHFKWMSARRELKEAVKKHEKFKKDRKVQSRIDRVRHDYAKKFGYVNGSLDDVELAKAKDELQDAGLDISWIKNNKDLNDLLYNKEDFYERFNPDKDKKKDEEKSFEEMAVSDGLKIQESPDQQQDRERTKKFYDWIKEAITPITEHFKKKDEDNSTEEAVINALENIEEATEANAAMNTADTAIETGASISDLRDATNSETVNRADDIIDARRDSDKKKKRDEKEQKESERARSGGKSYQDEEKDKKDKSKADIKGVTDEDKKTVFGSVGGFFKNVFGVAGKLFTSKTFWKLALGSFSIYAVFGEQIKEFYNDKFKPWMQEKALPFIETNIIPPVKDFLINVKDLVFEKAPKFVADVTGLIIDNMDTIVKTSWDLLYAAATSIGKCLISKVAGVFGFKDPFDKGDTQKFETKEEAQEKTKNARHQIKKYNEDGSVEYEEGYQVDDETGQVTGEEGFDGYIDENGVFHATKKVSGFSSGTLYSGLRAGTKYIRGISRPFANKLAKGALKTGGVIAGGAAMGGIGAIGMIPGMGMASKVAKGAAKGTGKVASKISSKVMGSKATKLAQRVQDAQSALLTAQEGLSAAEQTLKNSEAILDTTRNISTNAARSAEVFLEADVAANKAAVNSAKLAVDTAAKNVDDIAANKGIIKKLLNKLLDGLNKVYTSFDKKITGVITKANWTKTIKELIESLSKKFLESDVKLIRKIGELISTKMTEATARTAADGTGVLALVLGAFDALNGAISAADLFGVAASDVTWGMRLTSSIMEVILGIGPMAYIDIVLEVIKAFFPKLDFKRMLARAIYSNLGGKKQLDDAIEEFDKKVAIHNAKHGTNLTTEEYSNLTNNSRNIFGKIHQGWDWLWSGGGNTQAYKDKWKTQEQDTLTDAEQREWDAYKANNKDAKFEDWVNMKFAPTIQSNNPKESTEETYNGPGPIKISNRQKVLGYGTVMQNDPRWGNIPIGKFPDGTTSTMATGGCGPTALSMVASQLKSNTDPVSVASYAQNNGYIKDGGSTAGLFTKGASDMGLSPTEVNKSSIKKSLQSGEPVIVSGKSSMNGPYTKAGHIVVASGIDNNGNVRINDPMRGTRTEKLSNLTSGMTHGWSYRRKAVGYGAASDIVNISDKASNMYDIYDTTMTAKDAAVNAGIIDATSVHPITLINKVINQFVKFAAKYGDRFAAWFSSRDWSDGIKRFGEKIISMVRRCPVSTISAIANEISQKLAEISIRTGASAAIIPLIIGAVYDGVDGWTSAARLFGIAKHDVTWEMKTISSVLQVLLGLPGASCVDLVLEIISMINPQWDIKQIVARWLYSTFFDKEKLDTATDEFEAQVAKYNAINGTNLTVNDWNNKSNKDAGIFGQVQKGFSWVGAKISGGDMTEWNNIYNLQDTYAITEKEHRAYDSYKANGGNLSLAEWYTDQYKKKGSIGFGTGSAKIKWKPSKSLGFGPGDEDLPWFKYGDDYYYVIEGDNSITYRKMDNRYDLENLKDENNLIKEGTQGRLPDSFYEYLNGNAQAEKEASGIDIKVTDSNGRAIKPSKKTTPGVIATKSAIDLAKLGATVANNAFANYKKAKSNATVAEIYGNSSYYLNTDITSNLKGATLNTAVRMQRKIASGLTQTNGEYGFNRIDFYNGLKVKDIKNMVTYKKDLLSDGRIPLFREVYYLFVDSGDYKDNHVITTSELEGIKGKQELSEMFGGFGTYGDSFEYKNGFPFFQTDDPRWSNIPWRGSTVRFRGGDLASLAMVSSAFGNNIITPDYINSNWLDGRYTGWSSPGTGLNQDTIYQDGGFNALRETQVDGKRLQVKKLESMDSVINALRSNKPVVLTGYRYNGSIFNGFYDKGEYNNIGAFNTNTDWRYTADGKNHPENASALDDSNPDSYGTLVARAAQGDYLAVNDPFTTLEQPSVFNVKRLKDKVGQKNAIKSAYVVTGPNGEGISGPVDFSNKVGGTSDYQSVSEAEGLTGKIGAIFNNFTAVFEHMMDALMGGKEYRSIKEVNPFDESGADNSGIGVAAGATANISDPKVSGINYEKDSVGGYMVDPKANATNKGAAEAAEKAGLTSNDPKTVEEAIKKFQLTEQGIMALTTQFTDELQYAGAPPGTPDYENYNTIVTQKIAYAKKMYEMGMPYSYHTAPKVSGINYEKDSVVGNISPEVKKNAAKVFQQQINTNKKKTANSPFFKNNPFAKPTPSGNSKGPFTLNVGYGIGTGNKAFKKAASAVASVAMTNGLKSNGAGQGIVAMMRNGALSIGKKYGVPSGVNTKTDSRYTVTPKVSGVNYATDGVGGYMVNSPQNTGYTMLTNSSDTMNVDTSNATVSQKLQAIGFAISAQASGDDYEKAKQNALIQLMDLSPDNSGDTTASGGSYALTDANDETGYIWNELIKVGFTPAGAAGVMGNWQKESGNHAVRVQGDFSSGYEKSKEYTKNADANPDSFIHDKKGYGLAQWTYWSRKKGLVDKAHGQGLSVGDISAQVQYFKDELQGYPSLLNTLTTTNDVSKASNDMLHVYEQPADQSTREENERIGYSNSWLARYGGGNNTMVASNNTTSANVSYGPGKSSYLRYNILGKSKAIGYGAPWLNIVQAVKQAIAAQQPGYSQSNYITINVGGIQKSVRTDCSGFVSACVSYYTGQDFLTSSSGLLSSNNSLLTNSGFTYMPWTGWTNLVPGDILVISGHTEIFAGRDGNTNMVYNCGSNSSVNNPGITHSSRSAYTVVWRSPEGGSAAINNLSVANSGTNYTNTNSGNTGSSGVVKAGSGLDALLGGLNEVAGAYNQNLIGFGPGPSNKNMDTPEGYFTNTLGGIVTSGYGHRNSELGSEFHRGLDIGAPYGTDIKSPIEGDVISTGTDVAGYGNYAVVKDNDGTQHLFAHMDEPVGYGPGTHVYKDSVIGKVGSSGKSTGSHLHYELRRNDSHNSTIDPTSYKYDTKKYETEEDIGYGSGTMNTNSQVKEKLTVALNTRDIESKMDTIIDVLKTFVEREEKNNKEMSYNSVTNNNTVVSYGNGNTKLPRTYKTSSSKSDKDYSKMSLTKIHEAIAKK